MIDELRYEINGESVKSEYLLGVSGEVDLFGIMGSELLIVGCRLSIDECREAGHEVAFVEGF